MLHCIPSFIPNRYSIRLRVTGPCEPQSFSICRSLWLPDLGYAVYTVYCGWHLACVITEKAFPLPTKSRSHHYVLKPLLRLTCNAMAL